MNLQFLPGTKVYFISDSYMPFINDIHKGIILQKKDKIKIVDENCKTHRVVADFVFLTIKEAEKKMKEIDAYMMDS